MRTGLMFLPFSVAMIVAAVVVSRLVQKVNPGILAGIGVLIAACARVRDVAGMPYDDRVTRSASTSTTGPTSSRSSC